MKTLKHMYGLSLVLALLGAIILLSRPMFAAPGVQVLVPSHDIARGTVVGEGDFTYKTMPAGAVQPGLLQSQDAIIGQVSRRALFTGRPLRRGDFKLPMLVKRGAIVSMVYDTPGIQLTATMRAIKGGGMGETVIVQNPVSFKQVGAVVIGPGQVKAITAPSLTRVSRAGQ